MKKNEKKMGLCGKLLIGAAIVGVAVAVPLIIKAAHTLKGLEAEELEK